MPDRIPIFRGIPNHCRICGYPLESHERDVTPINCPECQAGLAAHTVAGDVAVPIIAKYEPRSGRWYAVFDDTPEFGFDADTPVVAIRRLLEFIEPANGTYWLICDRDLSGTGAHPIHREIIWDRPELLFPCGDCRGRGEYVGLIERETCQTCGGRKVVRV
jgi:hypothetical protein